MNKRLSIFFLLSMFIATLNAQEKNIISGKVINAQTGVAIANASIYIASTSHGTTSDSSGNFILHNVKPGKFQLVISYIGLTAKVYPFTADSLPMKIEARMVTKPTELVGVTVSPFLSNGWSQWGPFFMDNFIGSSVVAREAKILNPETIKFRFLQTHILQVVAGEPLLIENKALGYRIKYDLDDFTFDTTSHILYFQGYRYFEDMAEGQPKVSKRWLGNRRQAYEGSIMHFMRSLYRDKLIEEGFEVKRMIKQGKDYFVPSTSLQTADSLVLMSQDGARLLSFSDYLSITYKNAKADQEYVNPESGKKGGWRQESIINLRSEAPVNFEYNGNYFPPLNILLWNYWAWSEKVGRILPLDYDETVK